MDKRYQVFLSSTYADLREERRAVIQTIMELDCIPAGMELFPATDDEQWEFIKKVIDDCDYYVLIVGGRYGSTSADGVSFTEMEFEYAVESGIRVLAFLHEDPESVRHEDEDDEAFDRLLSFRERVQADRVVKLWRQTTDLPGLVALSLAKTLKAYPAVGWIRADQAPKMEVLEELNELRKERDRLSKKVRELRGQRVPDIPDIAGLDDSLRVHGTYKLSYRSASRSFEVRTTFREIFAYIAPYLMEHPTDRAVKMRAARACYAATEGAKAHEVSLDDQVFQTIKVQLTALGLVDVRYSPTTKGGMGLFWSLTALGKKALYETRVVRKPFPE